MHVAVVAYEGCLASGVSGFADTLAVANLLAGREVFAIRVLGPDADTGVGAASDGQTPGADPDDGRSAIRGAGAPANSSAGAVPGFRGTPIVLDAAMSAANAGDWDVVYVPPAFGVTGRQPRLAAWVGQAHAAGAVACAACAGVFVLAEAGILAGRTATTHWALAREFAATYPEVRLDAGRMLIDGGDYCCAGGVTAYFDLALRLTARFVSPEASAQCAQTLLLDPGRSSQTPYASLLALTPHGDAAIEAAEQWLEANLPGPVSVRALAAAVHLSERTLLRRFRKATGRTPKEYLLALRLELGKGLLATTGQTAAEIAARAGYADATAFYRLFKEMVGVTPGEYRRRFRCCAPGAPQADRATPPAPAP